MWQEISNQKTSLLLPLEMSSSNCHAFHIPHPKWANPLGEKPWAYAMLISWQSCMAAPALADLILMSSTSPDLQFTCGQSQQCLMTCCCLAFSELAVSVLFSRDGYVYSRKTKPVSGTTVGRLSSAPLPACQPARSLAELPLPSLESWRCDSLSVQIKCHWADFTAAALFHQDGRSRAREQPVGM